MAYLLKPRYLPDSFRVDDDYRPVDQGPMSFHIDNAEDYPAEHAEAYHLHHLGNFVPRDLFVDEIAVSVRSRMPDFIELSGRFVFVSQRAKNVIEDAAPGIGVFSGIRFTCVEYRACDDEYFYLHVSRFDQRIDFTATPTRDIGSRANDVATMFSNTPEEWIVRPPLPDSPAMWLEAGVTSGKTVYCVPQYHIFLSNDAFAILDKEFPCQLANEHEFHLASKRLKEGQ